MDMRRLVGRNAKRIRLERGLTQEQFAERSGFTQQYISGLEKGTRNPTIVSIFAVTSGAGVASLEPPHPVRKAARPRVADR